MIILAIETSCDDTCVSIIKKAGSFQILSNVLSSQVKIHQKYGGVYPALAKREHQKNLVPVLKKALKKAGLLQKISKNSEKFKIQPSKVKFLKKILKKEKILSPLLIKFLEKYQKPKIELLAVTIGPGLDPCLWQGINFAKALSYFWKLSVVPVDHIEAHILANFLPKSHETPTCSSNLFPAISLVVSGGHTQLILIEKIGKYRIIGQTRDDAAGECFDKTARILGLPYPGGPVLAQLAEQFKFGNLNFQIKLPRPMINSKNYDFSFSGLKTAVLYDFLKRPKKVKTSLLYIQAMAKEIQSAIVEVLVKKTTQATKDFKARAIFLGGGVAANNLLRERISLRAQKLKKNLVCYLPEKKFCTDNGAMVAIAGYFHQKKKKPWPEIKAEPNREIGMENN